jgi:hypothetical protein
VRRNISKSREVKKSSILWPLSSVCFFPTKAGIDCLKIRKHGKCLSTGNTQVIFFALHKTAKHRNFVLTPRNTSDKYVITPKS